MNLRVNEQLARRYTQCTNAFRLIEVGLGCLLVRLRSRYGLLYQSSHILGVSSLHVTANANLQDSGAMLLIKRCHAIRLRLTECTQRS